MDRDTRRELAKAIRPARERRRWSQQELVDKAGVARGVVQAAEAGGAPHKTTLLLMRSALGLDAEEAPKQGAWSPDVAVTLNMLGLFLESLTPEERLGQIDCIVKNVMRRQMCDAPKAD